MDDRQVRNIGFRAIHVQFLEFIRARHLGIIHFQDLFFGTGKLGIGVGLGFFGFGE